MERKYRKDTAINVSKTAKAAILAHIPKKIKISPWTEEAIYEKIEREKTMGNPVLERQKWGDVDPSEYSLIEKKHR